MRAYREQQRHSRIIDLLPRWEVKNNALEKSATVVTIPDISIC
jgi:hypothetical protein